MDVFYKYFGTDWFIHYTHRLNIYITLEGNGELLVAKLTSDIFLKSRWKKYNFCQLLRVNGK
jgi:hypothetical protein